MVAYAALVSLKNIIDDIQHHHSPPISFDNQQAQSLTQTIAALHQFLETHNNSSSVTEIDKADPLEMRIADAAYEAEDIIESHVVNRILPAGSHIASQEFLESHSSSVTEIDEVDPLERRISDAAYEAEDIVESHVVNRILPAGSQHRKRNRIIRFFNCFRALKKPENIPFSEAASYHDDQTNIPFSEVDDETKLYEDLQRVIDEMESIKKLTVQIDAEKEVVFHQRLRPVDASPPPSKSFSTTTRQKSITVCFDDVINEVMEKLGTGSLDRHVIPIVGIGGIGKTTLAKNIYGQPFIKEHFDICAWTSISQQYNAKEILCEVLCQATNKGREVLR